MKKKNNPIAVSLANIVCATLVTACLVLTQSNVNIQAAENNKPREVQSLDGAWEIIFDAENKGREGTWHQQEIFSTHQGVRKIEVPSCWEEIEQDYEGVAFYGHRFSVPESWKGKTVRLQFDAVNYIAEVYVNDHVAGRHEGGYGPFELRVEDLLHYGKENFISLRVIGPIVNEDKVIDGIGQSDMPHWRGAIAGGIWQSVRLVASGTVYVDDVFVQPRLADDTTEIQLNLENADHVSREVTVEVLISSKDKPGHTLASKSATHQLVPGPNENSWILKIPSARYWSPDDPHLYTATVRIADKSTIYDEQQVTFGMRELTIHDKKFELNGKPIYIKAAFFEGLYPTKLALPDNEAMARREIQLAIDCGFNMIRPWRKPPPPMWLDMCDEMGVMVIGGLPIECMKRWPTVTPHLRDRIENEVRSGVTRDRNRACIVQWEIFNEIGREDLARLKHPSSMLARHLDPTRMILDESGGFAGGSAIYLPGKFEPEVFNDVHNYPGAPLNDKSYDKFLALSKSPEELKALGLPPARVRSGTSAGRLTFVSEIGYGSLPDLVDNNERFAKEGNPLTPPYRYHKQLADWITGALKDSGLDSVYPDLQKFCLDQQEIHSQANKRMLEAIRSNSSTGGYCVHALTGGDWVIGAGLLDLFRNPKGSYWGTKEANQPRYLALRVRPRNIYAGKGANITITGINDLDDVSGKLRVEVIAADGTSELLVEKEASLVSGISSLLEQKLSTGKMVGNYTVKTQLSSKDGSVVAENTVTIDVFSEQQLAVPKAKIAVLDTNNSLRPFLNKTGIPFVEFNADTPKSLPVFVSKAFAGNPNLVGRFANLEKFVRQGGTAVYLTAVQRWGGNPMGGGQALKPEVFPFEMEVMNAKGLWVGVSHVVTDHPVFKGLPSGQMMDQIYENVWAPQSVGGVGGDIIVGSVSHGWYQGQDDSQNYQGPSEAWYGMDLGSVPHGEGRYVLSAIRVTENLGVDPVADKILFNLIDWSASL